MINAQETVARIVLDHSECASVFQKHRIDFCCKGDMSLEAAAKERKVEPAALIGELERAIAHRQGKEKDPRELSTAELIEYIVSRHHEYLRNALPLVQSLATKVARVHGDHNPKLRELEPIVREIAVALMPHIDCEEGILFPAMQKAKPDAGLIERELRSMHEEHLAVGKLLEAARTAADDFSIPEWACNSYRTLFSELEQMEGDVLRHVHLENHVLMPRFA